MFVAVCLALVVTVQTVAAPPPVAFQKPGACWPSIRFSPCGRFLVIFETTHRLTVWDVKTGDELWQDADVSAVWFGPKDGEAVVRCDSKGRYRRADLTTGEPAGGSCG